MRVTAWTQEDALTLLATAAGNVPVPSHAVEDLDISSLNAGHAQPNMLAPK
jgi:hypothetical protein